MTVLGWRDRLPPTRGALVTDAALAPYTWLRVGGPADVLFLPRDEDDLSHFLKRLDPGVPVLTLGVGSNVLIRDGGVEGVVVRLGAGFGAVEPGAEARVVAGAGALDSQLARIAAAAGLAGLEFYTGVPGSVGGALAMNAGCYGSETRDVLVEAYALTRRGERLTIGVADMGYGYRTQSAGEGLTFIGAQFQGRLDSPDAVFARMQAITDRRQRTQPGREKTGGSTFKNPPGHSAWRLIDQAGWRGRPMGGAVFSPLHANFLVNLEHASASDLETLALRVADDVHASTGITLDWEIKRLGRYT